jgi:hypothetical protein
VETYRIRWPWALAASVGAPVIIGVVTALLIPGWLGWTAGLTLMVALTALSLRRVRRRTLTVTASGLEVQRDKYAMIVGWNEVVRVQRRRHQLFIPVEELMLSGSKLVARSSSGKSTSLPPSLSGHPATRRILMSLYDKRWRHGPVGDNLQDVFSGR